MSAWLEEQLPSLGSIPALSTTDHDGDMVAGLVEMMHRHPTYLTFIVEKVAAILPDTLSLYAKAIPCVCVCVHLGEGGGGGIPCGPSFPHIRGVHRVFTFLCMLLYLAKPLQMWDGEFKKMLMRRWTMPKHLAVVAMWTMLKYSLPISDTTYQKVHFLFIGNIYSHTYLLVCFATCDAFLYNIYHPSIRLSCQLQQL